MLIAVAASVDLRPSTTTQLEAPISEQPTEETPELQETIDDHLVRMLDAPGRPDSRFKNDAPAVALVEHLFTKRTKLEIAAREFAESPSQETREAFLDGLAQVFFNYGFVFDRVTRAEEFEIRRFAQAYEEQTDILEGVIISSCTG
jgi:hypothetical protein